MKSRISNTYYSDKFLFNCPVCAKKLKIAKKHENDVIAGEYLVCSYCTSFIKVVDEDNVELMADDDIINLTDDERIAMIRIRKSIKELYESYGMDDKQIKQFLQGK